MDQKFSKNSKDPKFVATVNYKMYEAGAFVKANKKWLSITKTLAYYTVDLIIPVISFMIQAPVVLNILRP
jgi:hypothetical protein